MKKNLLYAGVGLIVLGCARVRVEAPKDPIKVDVSMRLDIYQHIEKDINSIEDMVTGQGEKKPAAGGQSLLGFFTGEAWAQEGLGPQVEEAVTRRKDRRQNLVSWQEKSVIGENKLGLLELRALEKADASVSALIQDENNDRMIIYQQVAQKNGGSLEDVQKLYAKRLQADAPAGTPIEVLNSGTGQYEWELK